MRSIPRFATVLAVSESGGTRLELELSEERVLEIFGATGTYACVVAKIDEEGELHELERLEPCDWPPRPSL